MNKLLYLIIPLYIGTLLLALIVSCYCIFFQSALFLCDNSEERVAVSPNNKFKAIIFIRNCGATTQESTQISILKFSDRLDDDNAGNILVSNGHQINNFSMYWESDTLLHLKTDNLAAQELFLKQDRFSNIRIVYD